MQDFTHVFEGGEDPRTRNATLHDLHAMLMIGLLTIISGGEGCSDMAIFGREKEDFLRRFLRLEHGIPSHDAFSVVSGTLILQDFRMSCCGRSCAGASVWGMMGLRWTGKPCAAPVPMPLGVPPCIGSRPLPARPSWFSARSGFPTSQTRSRPCRPFWIFWTATAGP